MLGDAASIYEVQRNEFLARRRQCGKAQSVAVAKKYHRSRSFMYLRYTRRGMEKPSEMAYAKSHSFALFEAESAEKERVKAI